MTQKIYIIDVQFIFSGQVHVGHQLTVPKTFKKYSHTAESFVGQVT